MNPWQIQGLHLSGHSEDSVIFKLSKPPLHPFQLPTQNKVVLPVSMTSVCFTCWSYCRPQSSSTITRNGCGDIPSKVSPASLQWTFSFLFTLCPDRLPKIQDCAMYLIFKVYGDYSDAAIHYAYIKCGLFTGSLSLWQPHRVWEESSATCRFSCTNICLFLHGEHFLKLFPVFQLLCSALQASNISNECCLFPCLVHLRISLGNSSIVPTTCGLPS